MTQKTYSIMVVIKKNHMVTDIVMDMGMERKMTAKMNRQDIMKHQ